MIGINNLSIKNKLVIMILLVTLLVIAIGFTYVILSNISLFKEDLVNNTRMTAQIIGDYSVVPLTFENKVAAEKILETLRNIIYIENGIIYDTDNKLFAAFNRNINLSKDLHFSEPENVDVEENISDSSNTDRNTEGFKTSVIRDDYLHFIQPINYNNEIIGTIYLRASTITLENKIQNYIITMLSITVGLMLLSYFLALKFQSIISTPILKLAEVFENISEKADYSFRFENKRKDEIGILFHGFNNMLNQIHLREIQRDEADKALTSSEEKYRTLTENLNVGIFRSEGINGNLLEINPEYVRMFGYENKEEYQSIDPSDLYVDPKKRIAMFKKLKRDGIIENEEMNFKKKDGTIFYGSVTAVTIKNTKGKILYYDGIIENISNRKIAEESLRKWAHVFENADWGIAIESTDGEKIEMMNPAFAEMHGYTIEELMGKKIMDIIVKDSEKNINSNINYSNNHPHNTYESVHVRKDGSVFPVLMDVTFVKGNNGDDVFRVFNVQDISYRKKVEEDKKNLEEQFFHAQKMESIGKLAGGIAHDFNNILSTIMINAEIIKRKSTDKIAKNIDNILEASKSSASLTKQLLGFARKGNFNPKKMDLNKLIKHIANVIEPLFEKRITTILNFNDENITVKGDEHQLEQVFSNLFINSKDAIINRGEIFIESKILDHNNYNDVPENMKNKKVALVTFRDTGKGISEENLYYIFDPFFTTKEEGKGTGLGLASVFGILKRHNCEIKVQSTLNAGTTFFIYFPVVEGIAKITKMKNELKLGAGKIMLVDDNENLREDIGEILQYLGYEVSSIGNGFEAVELYKLKYNEFDMILLDCIMPKKDGLDTYREMKLINPGVNVLVMSGLGESGVVKKMIDEGCKEFIQKPFSFGDLSIKVSKILNN